MGWLFRRSGQSAARCSHPPRSGGDPLAGEGHCGQRSGNRFESLRGPNVRLPRRLNAVVMGMAD